MSLEFTLDLCTFFKEVIPVALTLPSVAKGRRVGVKKWGCGAKKQERGLQNKGFYICHGNGKVIYQCLNAGEFFCPHWSSETTSTIDSYHKDGDYFLTARRPSKPSSYTAGTCNPITFKIKSSQDHYWNTGKTWEIRLYVTGIDPGTDPETLCTIQRIAKTQPKTPIGPLADSRETCCFYANETGVIQKSLALVRKN